MNDFVALSKLANSAHETFKNNQTVKETVEEYNKLYKMALDKLKVEIKKLSDVLLLDDEAFNIAAKSALEDAAKTIVEIQPVVFAESKLDVLMNDKTQSSLNPDTAGFEHIEVKDFYDAVWDKTGSSADYEDHDHHLSESEADFKPQSELIKTAYDLFHKNEHVKNTVLEFNHQYKGAIEDIKAAIVELNRVLSLDDEAFEKESKKALEFSLKTLEKIQPVVYAESTLKTLVDDKDTYEPDTATLGVKDVKDFHDAVWPHEHHHAESSQDHSSSSSSIDKGPGYGPLAPAASASSLKGPIYDEFASKHPGVFGSIQGALDAFNVVKDQFARADESNYKSSFEALQNAQKNLADAIANALKDANALSGDSKLAAIEDLNKLGKEIYEIHTTSKSGKDVVLSPDMINNPLVNAKGEVNPAYNGSANELVISTVKDPDTGAYIDNLSSKLDINAPLIESKISDTDNGLLKDILEDPAHIFDKKGPGYGALDSSATAASAGAAENALKTNHKAFADAIASELNAFKKAKAQYEKANETNYKTAFENLLKSQAELANKINDELAKNPTDKDGIIKELNDLAKEVLAFNTTSSAGEDVTLSPDLDTKPFIDASGKVASDYDGSKDKIAIDSIKNPSTGVFISNLASKGAKLDLEADINHATMPDHKAVIKDLLDNPDYLLDKNGPGYEHVGDIAGALDAFKQAKSDFENANSANNRDAYEALKTAQKNLADAIDTVLNDSSLKPAEKTSLAKDLNKLGEESLKFNATSTDGKHVELSPDTSKKPYINASTGKVDNAYNGTEDLKLDILKDPETGGYLDDLTNKGEVIGPDHSINDAQMNNGKGPIKDALDNPEFTEQKKGPGYGPLEQAATDASKLAGEKQKEFENKHSDEYAKIKDALDKFNIAKDQYQKGTDDNYKTGFEKLSHASKEVADAINKLLETNPELKDDLEGLGEELLSFKTKSSKGADVVLSPDFANEPFIGAYGGVNPAYSKPKEIKIDKVKDAASGVYIDELAKDGAHLGLDKPLKDAALNNGEKIADLLENPAHILDKKGPGYGPLAPAKPLDELTSDKQKDFADKHKDAYESIKDALNKFNQAKDQLGTANSSNSAKAYENFIEAQKQLASSVEAMLNNPANANDNSLVSDFNDMFKDSYVITMPNSNDKDVQIVLDGADKNFIDPQNKSVDSSFKSASIDTPIKVAGIKDPATGASMDLSSKNIEIGKSSTIADAKTSLNNQDPKNDLVKDLLDNFAYADSKTGPGYGDLPAATTPASDLMGEVEKQFAKDHSTEYNQIKTALEAFNTIKDQYQKATDDNYKKAYEKLSHASKAVAEAIENLLSTNPALKDDLEKLGEELLSFKATSAKGADVVLSPDFANEPFISADGKVNDAYKEPREIKINKVKDASTGAYVDNLAKNGAHLGLDNPINKEALDNQDILKDVLENPNYLFDKKGDGYGALSPVAPKAPTKAESDFKTAHKDFANKIAAELDKLKTAKAQYENATSSNYKTALENLKNAQAELAAKINQELPNETDKAAITAELNNLAKDILSFDTTSSNGAAIKLSPDFATTAFVDNNGKVNNAYDGSSDLKIASVTDPASKVSVDVSGKNISLNTPLDDLKTSANGGDPKDDLVKDLVDNFNYTSDKSGPGYGKLPTEETPLTPGAAEEALKANHSSDYAAIKTQLEAYEKAKAQYEGANADNYKTAFENMQTASKALADAINAQLDKASDKAALASDLNNLAKEIFSFNTTSSKNEPVSLSPDLKTTPFIDPDTNKVNPVYAGAKELALDKITNTNTLASASGLANKGAKLDLSAPLSGEKFSDEKDGLIKDALESFPVHMPNQAEKALAKFHKPAFVIMEDALNDFRDAKDALEKATTPEEHKAAYENFQKAQKDLAEAIDKALSSDAVKKHEADRHQNDNLPEGSTKDDLKELKDVINALGDELLSFKGTTTDSEGNEYEVTYKPDLAKHPLIGADGKVDEAYKGEKPIIIDEVSLNSSGAHTDGLSVSGLGNDGYTIDAEHPLKNHKAANALEDGNHDVTVTVGPDGELIIPGASNAKDESNKGDGSVEGSGNGGGSQGGDVNDPSKPSGGGNGSQGGSGDGGSGTPDGNPSGGGNGGSGDGSQGEGNGSGDGSSDNTQDSSTPTKPAEDDYFDENGKLVNPPKWQEKGYAVKMGKADEKGDKPFYIYKHSEKANPYGGTPESLDELVLKTELNEVGKQAMKDLLHGKKVPALADAIKQMHEDKDVVKFLDALAKGNYLKDYDDNAEDGIHKYKADLPSHKSIIDEKGEIVQVDDEGKPIKDSDKPSNSFSHAWVVDDSNDPSAKKLVIDGNDNGILDEVLDLSQVKGINNIEVSKFEQMTYAGQKSGGLILPDHTAKMHIIIASSVRDMHLGLNDNKEVIKPVNTYILNNINSIDAVTIGGLHKFYTEDAQTAIAAIKAGQLPAAEDSELLKTHHAVKDGNGKAAFPPLLTDTENQSVYVKGVYNGMLNLSQHSNGRPSASNLTHPSAGGKYSWNAPKAVATAVQTEAYQKKGSVSMAGDYADGIVKFKSNHRDKKPEESKEHYWGEESLFILYLGSKSIGATNSSEAKNTIDSILLDDIYIQLRGLPGAPSVGVDEGTITVN